MTMGNELYTDSGTPVRLEKDSFDEGGEGLIYETSRSGLCAKVYSGNDDSMVDQVGDQKRRKLQAMVRNPPEDPSEKEGHCSFAWPEEVLYREPSGQRCVGFLMPRIDTETFVELHVCKGAADRREKFAGTFHWRNLFKVGYNIASAVAALHEKGYYIGDINEENILVDYDSILITIIDCDSFQVRDPDTGEIFPSPVGKPEYTAPELSDQAKRYEDMKRTPESDAFALAILLFELLMENMSPYQGKGPALSDAPSTSAKLKKGLFPYISENKGVEPPPYAPPFKILHPHLKDLFIHCFDEGHGRPDQRPTAGEWFRVFKSLKDEDEFRRCESNDYHLFLNHLEECPWCEWSPPGVDDCFPSPHGRQSEGEGAVAKQDRLADYVETAAADGTITQAERRKLREKAQELGLKKSDLKELIRKSGATTSSTQTASNTQKASPGTPELEVEENRIQHKDLEQGATRQGSITFSNVGGGNLQGSLKAGGGGWLRTDRTSIDPSQHRQKVRYRIDTSNLAYGDSPTARIQIRSNGGNYRVPVSVSVETPEEATKRWRTRVGLIGLPVGALFGAAVSMIPLPAIAGVSTGAAFLAGGLGFSIMWAVVAAIIGSIVGSFVDSPGGCAAVGAPIGVIGGLVQWFSEVAVSGSPPNEFIETMGGMGTGDYVLLSAASWAFLFAITGALPGKWWAQIKSRGDSLKMRVAGVWGLSALIALLGGGIFSNNFEPINSVGMQNRGSPFEEARKQLSAERKSKDEGTKRPNSKVRVEGTVRDVHTGEPISGANVVAVGTDESATTNDEGNFDLQVPNSDATLRFSHEEYETKGVLINDRSELSVELERNVILTWKESGLRSGHSNDSEIVMWVSSGKKLKSKNKEGEFYLVQYNRGHFYIHKSLVHPDYRY